MALGSTQIVTAMSTSTTFRGLTTLPPSCADCLEIWEPQPPGNLRACNRPVHWLVLWFVFFYTTWIYFRIFFVDYISTRKQLLKSCAAVFMAYTNYCSKIS